MSTDSPHETIERLLTSDEAEVLLNVHHGFLAKDRVGTARIPFVKIGRSVKYKPSDLRRFIERSTRASTSDIRE
jgi:hypothetical protein